MKRKYDFFVGLGISLYILVFSGLSFLKYRAFEYHDFDLAAHSQTLWSIIHGSLYCSILGVDFLANHANVILFLIAPAYAVFPHPLTLLVLQTIFLGLVALPLYFIARKELDAKLGWLVVFMYLIYPQLAYANLFEFHPTVFAAFFLAMMYYSLYRNNFIWYTAFAVLSLLCQENIFMAVFMLGVLALWLKKPKRFIVTPIILSILWFVFAFYIAMPYFNKGQMQLISFYSHLGNNLPEVALSPILHPSKVVNAVLAKDNFMFVLKLFAPLSFIPLLGFEYLLVILPFIFQHLLSSRFTEKLINYHYAAEMLPFIFIALIYGLKRLHRRNCLWGFPKLLLIVFSVFFALYLGPLGYLAVNPATLTRSRWDVQKINLINKIPPYAGVVATFEFLPHLANRKDLHSFHNILSGLYPYSRKRFILPPSVDYALIDFGDPLTRWVADSATGDKKTVSLNNMRAFIEDAHWGVTAVADTVVLFQREAKGRYPLFKILKRLPKNITGPRVLISEAMEFAGYRFKPRTKGSFNLVFYWRCLKPTVENINFYLDVVDSQGRIVDTLPRNIVYGAYPTFKWKKGEVIEEWRYMFMPRDLPRGVYTLKIGFFDDDKKTAFMRLSGEPGAADAMGRVTLGQIEVN